MIDGHKYWFFSDGHMETGWAMIKGKKYHFAPDGKMDTGWFEYQGKKYYLNTIKDGYAETGWKMIDGHKYWFFNDGHMETGWARIGGYYLSLFERGCFTKKCNSWGLESGRRRASLQLSSCLLQSNR